MGGEEQNVEVLGVGHEYRIARRLEGACVLANLLVALCQPYAVCGGKRALGGFGGETVDLLACIVGKGDRANRLKRPSKGLKRA